MHSKPPFRFIHDVVMATLKETRVPAGLFNEAEQDAASIQARAGCGGPCHGHAAWLTCVCAQEPRSKALWIKKLVDFCSAARCARPGRACRC